MRKHYPITPLLLVAAAAASAQGTPSKLSYDYVRVGYAQSKEVDGLVISGNALLGDYVLIGGSYQNLTARRLDNVDGEATSFNLGVGFQAGPGDVILMASYGQLQAWGTHASAAVAVAANVTGFDATYRYAINQSFEVAATLGIVRTEYAGGAVDLSTGATYASAAASSDTLFGLAARYNLNKQFDVTGQYTWVDGNGAWALSVGYNF